MPLRFNWTEQMRNSSMFELLYIFKITKLFLLHVMNLL